jgi:hypothetical protein
MGVYHSAAAWGDYDADGDLDILLTGFGYNVLSQVYCNDGGFFHDVGAGLQGVHFSSVDWGDFDGDGDLDILISGEGPLKKSLEARVYRNENSQNWAGHCPDLTDIGAGLPAIARGTVAWGDFDQDGNLDILMSGQGYSGPLTRVYRTQKQIVGGAEVFRFKDIETGLEPCRFGAAAWGDYDGNGYPDILVSGEDTNGQPVTLLYHNNKDGTFTRLPDTGLVGVVDSSVDWGDFDNDGDLDILLTGRTASGEAVTRVYRNVGSSFHDVGADLPGVSNGSAVWGDYDDDGDLDILLTGQSEQGPVSLVYRNVIPAPAPFPDPGTPGMPVMIEYD